MRMKIAFAVGRLNKTSGIVRVVTNIIDALNKTGKYEIFVICTVIAPEGFRSFGDDVKIINMNINGDIKWNLFKMVGCIRKAISENAFDVLVVSGMEFVPVYYVAAHCSGVRMYAWEHLNFGAGPKFRLEWIGKRIAVRKFDGVICITKRDTEYYESYCKRKGIKNNIYQIYNLTDYDRKEITYNAGSNKIISVGYLAPIKGFDMLMEVAEALLKKEDNWSWDIFGKGSEEEHLRSLIEEKGLETHVFLKGYCTDINDRYSEYSMFVLTSRTEGMGMVLIEAQKSKLPVVSFDIDCGPSDVVSDGKNGFLIKPFDLLAMSNRIIELMGNDKRRREFSDNSKMNLDEFDEQIIVEKWEKMILEVKQIQSNQ